MTSYRYDLFISHNRSDKGWCRHLAQQIEGDDSGPPLRVFFDNWDLRPGSNIPSGLADAIDRSRRIAFILSPAAVRSDWVRMEMAVAIARRDPSGRTGVLVPLLRRDCEIPAELSHLSHIDFRRNAYQAGLRRLIDLLRDRSPDRGPGSAEIVRSFAEDCELIAAHRMIFARPAFSRPCIVELSLKNLAEAIDDMIAALNTGAVISRKGRLLARTEPQGKYQTDEFVRAMGEISDRLGELQRLARDFQSWFARSLPGYAGHDDCLSMLNEIRKVGSRSNAQEMIERMDEIDEMRNQIISDVNHLLQIANERTLPQITPSSRSPLLPG